MSEEMQETTEAQESTETPQEEAATPADNEASTASVETGVATTGTVAASADDSDNVDDSDSGDDSDDDASDYVAAVDDDDEEDDDESIVSRRDGPAVFNRAKEGGQRNPRYVGNDVRLDDINYKNVQVLSRFVDNHGRVYNRRKTRVSAKMQRKVTRAIKRARHLALMPYTGEHVRITRRRSS